MQPVQIKMARAALDFSVDDLASKAGVSHVEVLQLETGGTGETEAYEKARTALESAGIEWIDDDGVRFRIGNAAAQSITVEELTTENDK